MRYTYLNSLRNESSNLKRNSWQDLNNRNWRNSKKLKKMQSDSSKLWKSKGLNWIWVYFKSKILKLMGMMKSILFIWVATRRIDTQKKKNLMMTKRNRRVGRNQSRKKDEQKRNQKWQMKNLMKSPSQLQTTLKVSQRKQSDSYLKRNESNSKKKNLKNLISLLQKKKNKFRNKKNLSSIK